jgi:hypothetical protein
VFSLRQEPNFKTVLLALPLGHALLEKLTHSLLKISLTDIQGEQLQSQWKYQFPPSDKLI